MTSLGVSGYWRGFGFCFSKLWMDGTFISKSNMALLCRLAGQCTYLKVRLVQFLIVSNALFCFLKDADPSECSATPVCSHFVWFNHFVVRLYWFPSCKSLKCIVIIVCNLRERECGEWQTRSPLYEDQEVVRTAPSPTAWFKLGLFCDRTLRMRRKAETASWVCVWGSLSQAWGNEPCKSC